jgi:hypothetical protein
LDRLSGGSFRQESFCAPDEIDVIKVHGARVPALGTQGNSDCRHQQHHDNAGNGERVLGTFHEFSLSLALRIHITDDTTAHEVRVPKTAY